MPKMTSLGRAECKFLAEELEGTLQRAVKGYGLTVSTKGGKYDGATISLTFDVSVPALAETRANADALTLGAEFKIGDTFLSRGDEYTVTGFALNRRKYPVSASRTSDGKQFKFTVGSISRAIAQ